MLLAVAFVRRSFIYVFIRGFGFANGAKPSRTSCILILTALKDLLQDGKLVDLNRAIGLSLLGLLAAVTCVFVFTRRLNLVFV